MQWRMIMRNHQMIIVVLIPTHLIFHIPIPAIPPQLVSYNDDTVISDDEGVTGKVQSKKDRNL
jgi:hypothetical protein